MIFVDALNNLLSGKKLIRRVWSGCYLIIMDNQDYIWKVKNSIGNPTVDASIYVPSIEDLQSNDWILKP